MAETFDIGDVVVLRHAVTINGAAAEPATITADVLAPSGALIHGEYAGGAGLVSRVSTGVYELRVAPTESGTWKWRWATTGEAQEAEEGTFRVRRSAFVGE